MKIALIQGSTQADKNMLLYETGKRVLERYGHELINFGVRPEEQIRYTYTDIALLIALLVNSGSVDFVITGCSSGQGMNMACSTLPGLLSGYLQTPQDAYLFGRINDGNVASLPLGLGFGWLGELNLAYILEKLFDGEFGVGYPRESAARKAADTKRVKSLNAISKRSMPEVMAALDKDTIKKLKSKKDVIDYILAHAQNQELAAYMKNTFM